MTLADELKARAEKLGFLACGITDPCPPPHAERLDAWLAKGYAGTMRYLHRQARRRKDPRINVPESLAVVVLLENYYSPDSAADLECPRVAKYARGEDYHRVTLGRLEQLAQWLRDRGARVAHPYVDDGPIPERELAQRAGLGWIGKNTMLIRPGAGSFFFIGTIFTDLPLPADQPFTTDHCGTCTRCLEACPTGAFVEPHVLDATRCISYLTIEQKGPIPGELADRLQGFAFGCDICNDVCPWNERFAEPTKIPELRPRGPLAGIDERHFDMMDEEEFQHRYGGTPFARPGLAGMRRNVRAAIGSTHRRFHRLLEHDGWANLAALVALREGPAPPKALAWLAHIIGAERLWIARIRQEPSAVPIWPDYDLETCAAELTDLQGDWMRCLGSLDEEALQDGVAYRNSKGEFWTSTVADILTHVVLHASYHRGQIAAAIREAGGTPAYTDFIHAVRSGLIE